MATPPQTNRSETPESARPSERATHLAGAALVLAAALCFSTKAILIKLAYLAAPGADAIAILAARMALALPFFVAAALWSARRGNGKAPVGGRDMVAVAALGLLGYYAASLLDTEGLKHLSASTERLILFVYPTLVVLIGAVFLGERIRPAVAGALAATYAGVALAVGYGPGARGDLSAAEMAIGSAEVFGAALAFSVFLVTGVPVLRRVGATRFSAWTMCAAALGAMTHFTVVHGAGTAGLNAKALALCLAMALIATVLPAFLMAEGMHRIGAGPAALIGTVGPVATIGMDHAVLGQAVTGPQAVGTALVLAGVVAVSVRRREGS